MLIKKAGLITNDGFLECIIFVYNIVGVAVAMLICTMHEKSCIDLHNARKFEKRFQNAAIHISRNHNDETAKVESLQIS